MNVTSRQKLFGLVTRKYYSRNTRTQVPYIIKIPALDARYNVYKLTIISKNKRKEIDIHYHSNKVIPTKQTRH